ncbi:SU10 major capsid protein [Roseivirga spongicola]|uniref:SU10 major capsid protein n=1 Tax=Roseivirga spongicola TaxID=333140 RepID=UPI002AC904D5|nr:hypothetical protein [Roseivirga spongicola]WPZ08772.1 hypothetical protein T7867_10935 [Roseivirga spongicola]
MAAQNRHNVVGAVNASFMSLSNALLMPEVLGEAPDRYRGQANLFDFMVWTKRLEKTGQTEYKWTEEDALRNEFTIESVTGASGAGNAATITLEEANHIDSGTKSPVQVGDVFMVDNSNGRYIFRVNSVNKSSASNHTITAQETGVNLVDDLAAADIAGRLTNSFADGEEMPDGIASVPLDFSNYTQIVKTAYRINGSERANKVYRKINGKHYYAIKQEKRAKQDHDLSVNYALLMGQKRNDKTASNGETIYETGGMEWFAKTLGNDDSYTTWALADFTGYEQTLNANHVGNEVFFFQGSDLNISVNAVLRGLNETTGINYSTFGKGDGKQRSIDLGFDSFRINNRTYHQKVVEAMNAQGITQNTNLPQEGIIVPADKYTDKNGNSQFKLKVRYKESDKENRYYNVWTRDKTITNKDQFELNMQSEFGFQGFCGNEWIYVSK